MKHKTIYRWKCSLCGALSGKNDSHQTYFCLSHSLDIRAYISYRGLYGAELWMDRHARLEELVYELKKFIYPSRG